MGQNSWPTKKAFFKKVIERISKKKMFVPCFLSAKMHLKKRSWWSTCLAIIQWMCSNCLDAGLTTNKGVVMNRSIFVLLFCSCLFAQSRSSIMPAAMLNFDSLVQLPATPEEIINPALKDFPTQAIDSGSFCKKNGLLISEKKAATYLFYQYGYQRQAKELQMSKYLLNVHDSIARAVEKNIYWVELEGKNDRIAALEVHL